MHHNGNMQKGLRVTLAKNVDRLMKLKNLSQPDVENESGVGQSTISRILKQQTNLGLDKLEAVAHALRVHPWELLVDDEEAYALLLRRIRPNSQDSPS